MKRLLLVALLLFGCANTPSQRIELTPEVVVLTEVDNKIVNFTVRHPGMRWQEFLLRAESIVQTNFPELFDPSVVKVIELESPPTNLNYAMANLTPEGLKVITIFEASWKLCAVQDLAVVLLHEYMHLRIWESLEGIEDKTCWRALHEVHAFGTEVFQSKIIPTQAMHLGSKYLYSIYLAQAKQYCPIEILKNYEFKSIKDAR